MARTFIWRKSSYSGGGDGNNCVEVAALPTHVGIRDSKARGRGPLTVPRVAFTTFVEGLRVTPPASVAATPK
ncbi:DUF397 domain-containing protein [Streptomyces sp. NPDC016845]|uniref:DUF397 domain-containing protein n=1 Tax=Streptomyces sp. NPDC016845 TaxID=3364972 RepID=UPI0037A0F5C7